jgi:hypothetical protein
MKPIEAKAAAMPKPLKSTIPARKRNPQPEVRRKKHSTSFFVTAWIVLAKE